MKVDVTIVEEEDNHLRGFNLPQDSLISDLKVALAKTEGVDDPDNRLRVTFKTDSGDELGKLINIFLEVSIILFPNLKVLKMRKRLLRCWNNLAKFKPTSQS